MPDTIIERVAVGLEDSVLTPHLHGCSVQIHGYPRRFYAALARAALAAMRDPTKAMAAAGGRAMPWDDRYEEERCEAAEDAWVAMIDKALAEEA